MPRPGKTYHPQLLFCDFSPQPPNLFPSGAHQDLPNPLWTGPILNSRESALKPLSTPSIAVFPPSGECPWCHRFTRSYPTPLSCSPCRRRSSRRLVVWAFVAPALASVWLAGRTPTGNGISQ
ncbi:hypothetical protein MAPG_11052 [Magnaporthiopsis poae ATCC 64411]|uniref:Uncharacterized protein n=1 Tax=Magnaporthiopsis poae (strain ATCC 64411 / 73-15) TaxID=644358 RepID=A0A0C4EE87_MAGP6|nr:hypothetical protein MAPG_11052 [Magnaporthiopsis poae ATCC 64411]